MVGEWNSRTDRKTDRYRQIDTHIYKRKTKAKTKNHALENLLRNFTITNEVSNPVLK